MAAGIRGQICSQRRREQRQQRERGSDNRRPPTPSERATGLRPSSIRGLSAATSFSRPPFLRRNGRSPTGRDFRNLALSRRAKFGRGLSRANPQPVSRGRVSCAETAALRRVEISEISRFPGGPNLAAGIHGQSCSQFFAAAFIAPKRLLSDGSRFQKGGAFPAGQIWPRVSMGRAAASFSRPHLLRRNGCSPTGRGFRNAAISRRGEFRRRAPRANLQPTAEREQRKRRGRGSDRPAVRFGPF